MKLQLKGFETMKLNDILKQQGLTDDQISAISKAMKDNKVFTAGEDLIGSEGMIFQNTVRRNGHSRREGCG